MTVWQKHRRWIVISGITLAIAGPCLFALWTGMQIASPTRRPLMDYHRGFLQSPETYGIIIDTFTASDGSPCLLVTPAASGPPGKRGAVIREQLSTRSIPLPAFGEVVGTLVLTHGRKGRKEDYLPIAERFCAVGFRCVIPDLPAHGDHPVATTTYGLREAGVPARVLDDAARKYGFPKHPAGLMGMSMGGSVAIHSAAMPDAPWQALAVVSSFDSFSSIIEGQACLHAGTSLGHLWAAATGEAYQKFTGIPLCDIRPDLRAASIHIPTLIAHGSADQSVPMAAGRRLFDALPTTTNKKWIRIPDAGHDNVFVTDFPIYSEIAAWMILHLKPTN